MNRNLFWLLTVLLFASTHLVEAQQINRIPRIGILSPLSPGPSNEIHVFRQGLRELGYIEGQNVIIDSRFADGKIESCLSFYFECNRFVASISSISGQIWPFPSTKR